MIDWNVVFQEGVSWFENQITNSTQVFTESRDVVFVAIWKLNSFYTIVITTYMYH